ncbi:hypothetical protein DL546_007912 [Coniochaeta pulveracea]|uniref:Uncharacterized protein n=1 Tax=Coniochaeta pulveracea TaxID=177199 RepID=A0A420YBE6_9PEZI|nr:hypothetical protein DL546_007912 [Coniochaeta pulveracea]
MIYSLVRQNRRQTTRAVDLNTGRARAKSQSNLIASRLRRTERQTIRESVDLPPNSHVLIGAQPTYINPFRLPHHTEYRWVQKAWRMNVCKEPMRKTTQEHAPPTLL